MPTDLTSTSYAVLSLLGVRAWSAYELTQQMGRSLRWYWPKAESLVYAECKKLAGHGFATTLREHRGKRARTVYTITDAGRAALRDWFDRPLTPQPRLEFEALLQVAFADHGTREQLLENLKAIRADAEHRREIAHAQARDYAETGGPFPERLPVIALTGKFFVEYTELLARWAAWAERAVTGWDDVHPDGAAVPDGAFAPGHWPDPATG
ncbi:PadR family transcriptional regulator [Pseudonocardia nigra]|uniref:PadR family transcriptional regulator n=1 Tax=Pseudonocardia nigra TaxID=1921578 RepID=UPI001C603DE0|nr:PadR family transcriptional regulator [Pseudonocardia nigra]